MEFGMRNGLCSRFLFCAWGEGGLRACWIQEMCLFPALFAG